MRCSRPTLARSPALTRAALLPTTAAMESLPPAQVTVHQFGRTREPVVQIDGFSGQLEALLATGRAAEYRAGGAAYPGLRADADATYLDTRRDLVFAAMMRVFGFARGLRCQAAAFSLVTLPPEELAPLQRIPHYDYPDGSVIAVMHYLLGPETGGTAFYRHRRTGIESLTRQHEVAYRDAVLADDRAYGPPPSGYYYGDSDRYELIGEVEAAPDRLILYRGRLLHSGVIPDPAKLSPDPAKGRLTINMFLEGR